MLRTNLDQTVHELRFPARFLRNLQAAQCGKLYVEIAHFARAPADPLQHLQEFLLIAVAIRNKFLEQGLQPAARGAEAVDALRVLSRGKLEQSPLRLAEYKLAKFGCNRHRKTIPGSGRGSKLRLTHNLSLADSSYSRIQG